MKVYREEKIIEIENVEDLQKSDVIHCDNFEHLLQVIKNISYAGYNYMQKNPLELTIL